MNIKYFFTFSLLLCLSISFGKDKKTVIDRIQESEMIPVYFVDNKMKCESYNETFGKLPLTEKETSRANVDASLPQELIDINVGIIEELKQSFGTDKFVFIKVGTQHEVIEDAKAKGYGFLVQIRMKIDYGFDYKTKITRKYVAGENMMVSKRDVRGSIDVGFYEPHEKNNDVMKKYKTAGSFVYGGKSFEQVGYFKNVNKLTAKYNPVDLKEKFILRYKADITEMKENLDSKHAKAVAKRK